MIEAVIDAFFFFVGVGFAKAIVEPIARRVFRQKVMKYAPIALQFLDAQVPGLIGTAKGEDIEEMVRKKLESLTGENWSQSEIDSVFQLYDVRIGATKALSNGQQDRAQ